MDDFLTAALADVHAAAEAAGESVPFSAKAEKVRVKMRAATAKLLRLAVDVTKARRPGRGKQLELPWLSQPRAQRPFRHQPCLAEPQAPEGEGSQPPHEQASGRDMAFTARRPLATAAAGRATAPNEHAPFTS